MDIPISVRNEFDASEALDQHIAKRLEGAFRSHERFVQKVDVRLSDANGPRKGPGDKVTLIEITLRPFGDIVAKAEDEDIYKSVTTAAARVKEALSRMPTRLPRHRAATDRHRRDVIRRRCRFTLPGPAPHLSTQVRAYAEYRIFSRLAPFARRIAGVDVVLTGPSRDARGNLRRDGRPRRGRRRPRAAPSARSRSKPSTARPRHWPMLSSDDWRVAQRKEFDMVLEFGSCLAVLALVWIASGFSGGRTLWLTRDHLSDIL